MILTLIASAALCAAAPVQDEMGPLGSTMTAPSAFVAGEAFVVRFGYSAQGEDVELDSWLMGPAAFSINGKPLASREGSAKIVLPAGSKVNFELNLTERVGDLEGPIQLAFAPYEKKGMAAVEIPAFTRAAEGLNFMEMPEADLGNYRVLMITNRGNMLLEFFPDKAPGHVRNFLDLCSTGFYAGTQFHRVSPTFMIQGGCPNTKTDDQKGWGTGRGPRMLDAEFNDVGHTRGILSMARSQSPDSASCQFFVITADSSFLDNQYSVFGRMISGDDALDAISKAPGRRGNDGTVRPSEPQRIEKAIVLTKG